MKTRSEKNIMQQLKKKFMAAEVKKFINQHVLLLVRKWQSPICTVHSLTEGVAICIGSHAGCAEDTLSSIKLYCFYFCNIFSLC